MMTMTIILIVMMLIVNNNFNEVYPYQILVYPRYVAMQYESVLWTAVICRNLLSPKVQFNWWIRQKSSTV